MHRTTIAAAAAAALAAPASAASPQMQLNYYSDQCRTYVGDVKVTWATALWGGKDNCFNYSYGSFVNIANCYKGGCQCNMFYGKDCTGASTKLFDNHNCVGGAPQIQSFACYYT
ncbi:hypothetical protein CCM_09197 [Cordyceps militaris CM01]|uniref:Secreted protein n=1 Tax=Cordyceps militaris (strain CM01) TaxID=983644 RepID=G3JTQ7_CORMM|nr:uncharacterized protein CCM_09197 [Cordyceps militaris CM01]EGX88061.1 hypothetical protein CCM_09197 [Cordyceps militaris CM01]